MQLDARLVCLVVPTGGRPHGHLPSRPAGRRPANNYVVYHAHNHGVCDSMSSSIHHARNSSALVLIHHALSLRYKIELRLMRCVCGLHRRRLDIDVLLLKSVFLLSLGNRRRSSARPICLGFSVSTELARRLLGGRSCTFVALTFSRSLQTFRLTFLHMRDKCKIIIVQRNDKVVWV